MRKPLQSSIIILLIFS